MCNSKGESGRNSGVDRIPSLFENVATSQRSYLRGADDHSYTRGRRNLSTERQGRRGEEKDQQKQAVLWNADTVSHDMCLRLLAHVGPQGSGYGHPTQLERINKTYLCIYEVVVDECVLQGQIP